MNVSVNQMLSKLILIYSQNVSSQESLISDLEWKLKAAKSKLEDDSKKLEDCMKAQSNENLTEGEFLNL